MHMHRSVIIPNIIYSYSEISSFISSASFSSPLPLVTGDMIKLDPNHADLLSSSVINFRPTSGNHHYMCQYDCARPSCSTSSPYAIANGASCCPDARKIDDGAGCDGSFFQYGDSNTCCGLPYSCPSSLPCVSNTAAAEKCRAHTGKTMQENGYAYEIETSLPHTSYYATKNHCKSRGGEIITLETLEDVRSVHAAHATEMGSAPGSYWIDLGEDYNSPVNSCADGSCDNSGLKWRQSGADFAQSAYFKPVSGVSWNHVANTEMCAYAAYVHVLSWTNEQAQITSAPCWNTGIKAMCKFPCSENKNCDLSKPFYIQSGTYHSFCCREYFEINDPVTIHASCDGEDLNAVSHPNCCPSGKTSQSHSRSNRYADSKLIAFLTICIQ